MGEGMSEKRFTKTVPVVDGYYWLRNWCIDDAAAYDDGPPKIAKLIRSGNNRRVMVFDPDETVTIWLDRLYQGEWKGPLKP